MNPLWTDIAARADIALGEQQHALLSRYLDLLLEANARMNLTRITDRAAAELQHVADSFTLLPYLPKTPHALADVGSGGGVPGIPLAIARPDARVTLIEATKKKAVFLKETVAALQLSNVTIVDQRAEDVARGDLREAFDIAIARAVATMDWLAEWCLPLVSKGGKMLAMKGPKVNEELPTAEPIIRLLGGMPPIVHPVDLPGTEHRVIVEITKGRATSPRYPRPATVAKGKPLSPA
ncbi:MAG TPA: 16S rRNA (guanine(527)-N(7))-methyltransferase RsmG [Tepidisphaeraceae bacterium]|nr:16S rRNA (guanine(527)-N(7))-methyltransferase RsmG [Tepidisphaeraceae bacterium]